MIKFVNNGPWSLKEHAICSITATSASNAAPTSTVFAAQDLFYNLPLSAATVILSTISIGLFGYGICGILRPIAVWHTEAVYWSSLPTVKTLQGLHWQEVKNSKPLRYFWYAFTGMSIYEIIPAYIFPWLNSVSIPVRGFLISFSSWSRINPSDYGNFIGTKVIDFRLYSVWLHKRPLVKLLPYSTISSVELPIIRALACSRFHSIGNM